MNGIDFDLAKQVAILVGGIVPKKPAGLNHEHTSAALVTGELRSEGTYYRFPSIAILIADGFNATEVDAFRAAFASVGALNYIIGPHRGKIGPASDLDDGLISDHHFEGQRSTMFDAQCLSYLARNMRRPWRATAELCIGRARPLATAKLSVRSAKASLIISLSLLLLTVRIHIQVTGVDFIHEAVRLPGVKLFDTTTAASDNVVSSYGVVATGKYSMTSTVTDIFKMGSGSKSFAVNFEYEVSKHRCYERETDGLAAHIAY